MRIEDSLLFDYLKKDITDFKIEADSQNYIGSQFKIDNFSILFRKAKVTPIKPGAFVALWKRNSIGENIPFEASDPFDFYFFEVEDGLNRGIFIFPKNILVINKILTSETEGKRGFRLYPSWCYLLNKTAQKTQKWQLPYFIDLNLPEIQISNHLKKITQI